MSQPRSSDALQARLREINDDIAYKIKLDPLLAHRLLPMQIKFRDDQSRNKAIFGGNRCLGGETKIYNPVTGRSVAIEDISGESHVLAWDGRRLVIAEAGRPFKKNIDLLFGITLSSGESFVCSDTHQVLTLDGYRSIRSLVRGDVIFRPLSILGFYRATQAEDDQSFWQKAQNWLSRYFVFCRPDDVQPQQVLHNVASVAQLRDDAPVRISAEIYGHAVVITSIIYKRYGVKWDLTVPEYHNYYACGAIHHNSGKTEGVADYVVRRILERPGQKWWVVGETYQDSIAIQQNKIWGLIPRREIRYGYYDEINGFRNQKLLLKNGSLITFKSYVQGREAFQSDDLDGIWDDEEPPITIYQEQRMRLIDRDGELLISMTSVKGVTELISEIFDEHEAIESQYAELVGKELPRIADKNGFRFYFLWTTENPHINQGRVLQEAKLLPRDELLARIYGMPINLTGRIYIAMSKLIHVIPFATMPEGHYSIYMVLDPHDRKPWAMIWIAVHKTGTAYVIDEYPNKNFNEMQYDDKTYADYAKIIKDKEIYIKDIFGTSVRRRILDPNFGNKTVQLAQRQGGQSSTTPKRELAKLGFTFRDGIDALEAGHLEVRKWLHYQRAESGEIVVQPKLMFVETCHNTIRHMMRYSRKSATTPSGDEKNKVGPMEKYKDFPDCVRYGVMSNLVFAEDYEPEPEFKKAY